MQHTQLPRSHAIERHLQLSGLDAVMPGRSAALHTGTFKGLPSVITDLCGRPKADPAEEASALRLMSFLLRKKLLKVSLCALIHEHAPSNTPMLSMRKHLILSTVTMVCLYLLKLDGLQETLPSGMRVQSIGNGHASLRFQDYYSVTLSLAEAPATQAELSSHQHGQSPPAQAVALVKLGDASDLQQEAGTAKAMDADPPAGSLAWTDAQVTHSKEGGQPHQEKYRWRLLTFEVLPRFQRAALTPEQQSGLQSELEFQMWRAADIRAQCSLAVAQRAQQAQHGADTAQSGPTQTGPEVSQQPASALIESSNLPTSHDQVAHAQTSQQGRDPGEDPFAGPPHPLQLMHNVLAGLAGRVVLHEVHGRLRQMLDEKGRWARLLKLNAAAVLSNGIRQASQPVHIVANASPTLQ